MGYSYDMSNRLCCDSCGVSGGVRKRKCKYTVTWHDGMVLAYCPSPALCARCYKLLGGLNGVHGERCRNAAAESQREQDEIRARLTTGDSMVRAAWGDWQDGVPVGKVGVMFRGNFGDSYWLMPKDMYRPGKLKWLTEYAALSNDTLVTSWAGPR